MTSSAVDQRPEEVVARLRSHPRATILPSLLLVALSGLVPFFAPQLPEGWPQWLLLGGAALLLAVGVLLPLLAWAGRSYTITTRRIVLRRGVLVRNRKELLHSRGSEVSLRAAGLQLLFRSGDVVIDPGSGQSVVLVDVPHAELVQSALVELMEASRNPVAGWRHRTDELPDSPL